MDALGGQSFESGQAGLEWLQFLLEKLPTPPAKAMRKAPPLEKKRVRVRGAKAAAAAAGGQPVRLRRLLQGLASGLLHTY